MTCIASILRYVNSFSTAFAVVSTKLRQAIVVQLKESRPAKAKCCMPYLKNDTSELLEKELHLSYKGGLPDYFFFTL